MAAPSLRNKCVLHKTVNCQSCRQYTLTEWYDYDNSNQIFTTLMLFEALDPNRVGTSSVDVGNIGYAQDPDPGLLGAQGADIAADTGSSSYDSGASDSGASYDSGSSDSGGGGDF